MAVAPAVTSQPPLAAAREDVRLGTMESLHEGLLKDSLSSVFNDVGGKQLHEAEPHELRLSCELLQFGVC